jgi:antitoxin Phd
VASISNALQTQTFDGALPFEQPAISGAVVITKHDTPAAVLLSYAEFVALTASAAPAPGLGEHFDVLFASMQTPQAKAGVAAAFDATPVELEAAAVKGARTTRRR